MPPKITARTAPLPHGIDITAPGGIARLLDFHRLTFGDAVMELGAGGEGGTGGEGGAGGGEGTSGGTGGQPDAGSGEGGAGSEGNEPLGEGGKKALQAEREANKQLKSDLAAREARIKELEDATKTDEQKRNERFEALEQSDRQKDATIASQQGVILRYQVAAAKGLDLEAAERLRGATKEEIEADADAWIAKWGSSKAVREVPGAGHRGSDHVEHAPGLGRLRAAYSTPAK